jgi:hypothetical protein
MPKNETRRLSGAIEVLYSWEESSSGHIENESSVQLVTEDKNVVLKEKFNHRNSSKSSLSRNTEICYEIDIERLLLLIREHGKLRLKGENQGASVSGSSP